MTSSLEDAMPFFNKWKAEQTLLDINFSGGGGLEFCASARISPRSDKDILELVNLDCGFILRVSLPGRVFRFADPLSALPEKRMELTDAGLVQCWEIGLSRTDNLGICESRRR
jgi:hypothetical protein